MPPGTNEMSWNIHTVFHAVQLLQKLESLQQVSTVSSPRAWGNEEFVQSGFHTCSVMTKEPFKFFSPPPICSIAEMKELHSQSHFNG
jgi:hypothetical protein